MGLDGVALVIACEDRFGIEIEDREAEGCLTVADLQDVVVRKVGAGAAGTCHSMRVFHRLRTVLAASSALTSAGLAPRTPLRAIMPRDVGRARWSRMQASLSLTLPVLEWPRWASRVFMGCIVGSLSGLFLAAVGVLPWWFAGAFLLAQVATGVLLVRLRPNTVIPRDLETIGDLVRSVVALNYRALNERAQMIESEVRDAVAQVVSEELGVSRRQVKPAARFVADLGVD